MSIGCISFWAFAVLFVASWPLENFKKRGWSKLHLSSVAIMVFASCVLVVTGLAQMPGWFERFAATVDLNKQLKELGHVQRGWVGMVALYAWSVWPYLAVVVGSLVVLFNGPYLYRSVIPRNR